MSSIFGVLSRQGQSLPEAMLGDAFKALRRWSPDRFQVLTQGPLTLAHAMLWNTPESQRDRQPRECDGSIVCFDGRLDNRDELMQLLGIRTPANEPPCDSELVLQAYASWGEQMPSRLLGDFAFVIWDSRRQELLCVRDQIGIRPLYTVETPEYFAFSSDIASLLALPFVSPDIRPDSVATYLQSSTDVSPHHTFYRDIEKFPAATQLHLGETRRESRSYWSVEDIKPLRLRNDKEYCDRLGELLEQAVADRARTAYPLSLHVTGGLDSSAIAVALASLPVAEPCKVTSYSWLPAPETAAQEADLEWKLTQQVVDRLDLEHVWCGLDARTLLRNLETSDISHGHDCVNWSECWVRTQASARGSRTILSGWGGDQLISYGGHLYLSMLIRRGHGWAAFKEIRRWAAHGGRSWRWVLRQWLSYLAYACFPGWRAGHYRHSDNTAVYRYLKPPFHQVMRKNVPAAKTFNSESHGEQKVFFSHSHLLHRIEYNAASARENRLEYTYPLLDRRIVEFALAIPEEQYLPRNGYSRHLIRAYIKGKLPDEVVWAPKFAAALSHEGREALWQDALRLVRDEGPEMFTANDPYVDVEALYTDIENLTGKRYKSTQEKERLLAMEFAVTVGLWVKARMVSS